MKKKLSMCEREMHDNVDNKRYASPIFVSLSSQCISENVSIQSHIIPIVRVVKLLNDRSNGDQLTIDTIE